MPRGFPSSSPAWKASRTFLGKKIWILHEGIPEQLHWCQSHHSQPKRPLGLGSHTDKFPGVVLLWNKTPETFGFWQLEYLDAAPCFGSDSQVRLPQGNRSTPSLGFSSKENPSAHPE